MTSEDERNQLIERYKQRKLSSVEFHRAWVELSDPPAEDAPEQSTLAPPPERLEECANIDELERWWQIELEGHLVPGKYERIPPPRNQSGCLLVIFLCVSAGGLYAAFSSGWPAILAVLAAIALLIKPVRREMWQDDDLADRYELAHASYLKRRDELIRSNPEELRWEASEVEDLERLDNQEDVERWWRHAQKRYKVGSATSRVTKFDLVGNIGFLVAMPVTWLPLVYLVWVDPKVAPFVWWLAHLGLVFLLGYCVWAARSMLRAVRAYNRAEKSYQSRLEELGLDRDS
jgi:hypothetical protein